MCGIAGIVDFEKPVNAGVLKNMLARIIYRGPDESGIYLNQFHAQYESHD